MVHRRIRLRLAAVLVPLLVIAGLAVGLQQSQEGSRDDLADRFTARGQLAASFIATYAEQLLDRERDIAEATMSGPRPGRGFRAAVHAFGVDAAVLLDERGTVLAVAPDNPDVVGTRIAGDYVHLSTAVRGQPAVSGVVPSAARAEPVVGFAAPFDTPRGRRVFSGAHSIADTPLASFLAESSPIPGHRAYLVDAGDGLIADSDGGAVSVTRFTDRDPATARAASNGERGTYDTPDGEYFFSRHAVPGTSWVAVLAAPTGRLFAPVSGSHRVVPWLILLGLAVLAGSVSWLGMRYVEDRHRVHELNEALSELARTDELTGLPNRRHMVEHLEQVVAHASRHESQACVAIIDIDHFKRLNDTFGHNAGDEAIRAVAARLARGMRTDDLLSRWGGEEFLAVLPDTSLDGARQLAERLRSAVSDAPIAVGTGGDEIDVTVSIGLAEFAGEHRDVFVHRADTALYDAKAAGRNMVCSARTAITV